MVPHKLLLREVPTIKALTEKIWLLMEAGGLLQEVVKQKLYKEAGILHVLYIFSPTIQKHFLYVIKLQKKANQFEVL